MSIEMTRAFRAFDAMAFTLKHRGRKESRGDRSHEYLFTCPLCGGHNLRWNPTKAEGMGGWVCWNCLTSGNTLYLVQLFERLSTEDAIAYVIGEYNGGDAKLELLDLARMPEAAAIRRPTIEQLPTLAWPAGSVDARQHERVRAYLYWRGIDDALIAQWGIRAGTRSTTNNYALFPVYMDGGLVYWQGRASWDPPPHLTKEQKHAWIKATNFRKTLNPWNPAPGIKQATAGEVLFNYDRARTAGHVVICEGPVDAIKVGPHAVALLGKGTDQKIQRLQRMGARRYTVYLDRGEEEREKAYQIGAALAGWAEVHLAVPPEGYDAGALTPEQNAYVVAHAEPFRERVLQSALRP